MNYALFEEGLKNERTTYARHLLKKNGGQILSSDEQKTASLLCNAAIEARVIGLDRPAMSITGSGAHGIIATMPLYGVCKIRGLEDEALYRATALSYLICMYIKEYSGKLSAFCGCGIAAGTGMACALVYLWGGDDQMMAKTINNMASSITGMICHGGNKGCTMKGVVAVDAAFQSAELGMNGIFIDDPSSPAWMRRFRSSTFSSIFAIVARKAPSSLPLGSSSPQSSRWEQGKVGHWTLQPMVTTMSTGGSSESSLLYCPSSMSTP